MLPKLIEKNPSRTFPISLKEIRLWRRRMKRTLPFSNNFFFFAWKLLTFDYLRELYQFLLLTLNVNTCLFVGFYSPSLFIYHLCFIHSYVAFCFQFLKHVSVRPFKELFIQELNIPIQFGISKWYQGIDPSIFGLLSRNIDSTHGIFEKILLLWWTHSPIYLWTS